MLGIQSGVCSYDSKSSGGTSGVTFDSNKHFFKSNNADSDGSEFSVSDTFLGDRSTPVYNHSLSFPPSGVTHTGNSLNFFENTGNSLNFFENTSTDFLCDDLPEIGNFEDIDRMFRSDSTFGLVDSKEDEFGWLSSEYDKGESREVLRSNFGIPCHETSMLENVSEDHGSSKSYTGSTGAPIWTKDGPCTQEKSDSYTSFVNGLGISDGKYGIIPEEQINECKKQLKQLKHSQEKRNEHNFENGSDSYLANLPFELNQLSTGATFHQHGPSVHMSQQLGAAGPDSIFYLQNDGSQPYSDNSPLSDQASVNFTNSTAPAPWVSSHPSSQMQFMGSSHDPQSLLTALPGTENEAELHTFQSNLSSKNASLMEQASIQEPGSVGKQAKLCGDKFENPADAGASLFIPGEPGSSSVQESSITNVGVDDISLAAASFCQLQLVMEWLDSRTKLCIRDGLYRLAWSAEQRQNHADPDDNSSGGSFTAEGTNSCTSLTNMETGTNSIDRSIAQLLFHRPDSSMISAHDV